MEPEIKDSLWDTTPKSKFLSPDTAACLLTLVSGLTGWNKTTLSIMIIWKHKIHIFHLKWLLLALGCQLTWFTFGVRLASHSLFKFWHNDISHVVTGPQTECLLAVLVNISTNLIQFKCELCIDFFKSGFFNSISLLWQLH